MSKDSHDIEFGESLEDSDFGLIVCGKTGMLKGLWIPQNMEDEPVPESVYRLCVDYFGIDPAEFDDDMGDPITDTVH